MTQHPGRPSSWPQEIRDLYHAVIRGAAADDADAFNAALDRLLVLAEESDDAAMLRAARHACVKLALLYDPEGLAACIASGAGFRGSLRPLIDAGSAGLRRGHRARRRSRHRPRSA